MRSLVFTQRKPKVFSILAWLVIIKFSLYSIDSNRITLTMMRAQSSTSMSRQPRLNCPNSKSSDQRPQLKIYEYDLNIMYIEHLQIQNSWLSLTILQSIYVSERKEQF